MRRAKLVVVSVGLAITAATLVVVLSESPPRVLATTSPATEEVAVSDVGYLAACQANETLPRGTTAIRISLAAFIGPPVKVTIVSHGHKIAAGGHESAWSGQDVTVPLREVSRTVPAVTVCFATVPLRDELIAYGRRTGKATAAYTSTGAALPGRVSIEYLGAGGTSWLSLITTVARHMGLGRGWSGTWVALLVAMLTLAASALAYALLLRESDG
jgi:hypothetical protein